MAQLSSFLNLFFSSRFCVFVTDIAEEFTLGLGLGRKRHKTYAI